MITLRRFLVPPPTIPTAAAWYLSDLGEAKGTQELFTKQSPQKLKTLREHALIESAVSSNRIEGVEVEWSRVGTVLFGTALLRDRDEEEVRGYRRALDLIQARGAELPVSEDTIRLLHSLSRGGIGDAGEYKRSENDVIEVFPTGRREIRFRTVRAADTPAAMAELVGNWARSCTPGPSTRSSPSGRSTSTSFASTRSGMATAGPRGSCSSFSATISDSKSGGTSAWSGSSNCTRNVTTRR